MTDRHLRILRLMAQQRQLELRNYDADHNGDAVSPDHRSPDHRQHLERAATRTSARVADAQARRRRRKKSLLTATRRQHSGSRVLPEG